MILRCLFFFCLFAFWGSAAEDQPVLLKKIIVTKDPSQFYDENNRSIYIDGLQIDQSGKLIQKLRVFIGKPITLDLIKEIKTAVSDYYIRKGDTLTVVVVPEQEVQNGAVFIQVIMPKVGKVTWTGNKNFSTEKLNKYFNLQSGDDLSQDFLLNEVSWKNRNPFHFTEVVLRPTDQIGVTDIELRTQDRKVFRFYGGADNTGNDVTGNTRTYLGFNWGNALGLGDVFTYQFTFNPMLDKFISHFLQYISYLPWKHILTFWGGYSTTWPPAFGKFVNKAVAGQGSFRYEVPFKPFYGPFTHEISFGMDWKYTNSNVLFASFGTPVVESAVNVLDLVFNYGFSWQLGSNDMEFSIDAFWQPYNPISSQSEIGYNTLRPGASVHYAFAEATFSDEYVFSTKDAVAFMARGQIASGPLLPMQEFTLGGYNTVRGYHEQAYLADDAICLNLELKSRKHKLYNNSLGVYNWILFADYGKGWIKQSFGSFINNEYLASVGFGLRYYLGSRVSLRADYGFKLHDIPGDVAKVGKLHVGGQFNF